MLDLVKLRTFLTVATTGSFSSASLRLCYSQSAVSTHILSLERELGTRLFDRISSKKITLTAAGKQMLSYAPKILALADEAKRVVSPQNFA